MSDFEMVSFNDVVNRGIGLITRIRRILFIIKKYDGIMYPWDELLDCEKKSILNELYNIRRETDKCIENYKLHFSLSPSATLLDNFYIEINSKIELEKAIEARCPVLTELYNLMYYSGEVNKKMTKDKIIMEFYNKTLENALTIKDNAKKLITKINSCEYDHEYIIEEKERAIDACNYIISESKKDIDKFTDGVYLDEDTVNDFNRIVTGYINWINTIEKDFDHQIYLYEIHLRIYKNEKPKITKGTKTIATVIFNRLKEYDFDASKVANQFNSTSSRMLSDTYKSGIIKCLYHLMRDYSGYDIEDIKKTNNNVTEYMNGRIHDMLSNTTDESENISNKNINRLILYSDMINCILTIESIFESTTSKEDLVSAFYKLNMLDDPQNMDTNKKTG